MKDIIFDIKLYYSFNYDRDNIVDYWVNFEFALKHDATISKYYFQINFTTSQGNCTLDANKSKIWLASSNSKNTKFTSNEFETNMNNITIFTCWTKVNDNLSLKNKFYIIGLRKEYIRKCNFYENGYLWDSDSPSIWK